MKKFLLTSLCLISMLAQSSALDAYFDFRVFHVPGEGPMVETYLNFFGESLQYAPVDSGQQAGVEITMMFFDGDSIVDYSKKVLKSPIAVDSTYNDFIDQQRFILDYGEYVLEIQLRDLANPEGAETLTEAVLIDRPKQEVFLSDIQWISAVRKSTSSSEWTKSGFDLLPFVSNYVPREMGTLMFYAEIYGTAGALGTGEAYLMRYYLEQYDDKTSLENFSGFARMNASLANPVLKQLDIRDLPTGNYNLVIEARNSANELIAQQRRFFQRQGEEIAPNEADYNAALESNVFSKQITDVDTLFTFIQSLYPIAGDGEKSLIARFDYNKDIETMQRFFYNFWYSRNNQSPAYEWAEYRRLVKIVEDRFATPSKPGYETDMGRVFLAYGPPDVITDRPSEPSSYPYQIWQYFRADQWTNVRFIFYDRTLLQSDYELLHCDKVRGEIKNPRWQMLLHQRDTPLKNVDDTESRDHFGGRSRDFWDTPR